jgi:hypothetical protein
VDRTLARIRLGLVASYYRRVAAQAAREATHPWVARLGTTASLAVLSFVFSWVFTGKGGFTSLAVALATVGAFWFLVVLWFVVTIPPRIEREMQNKEVTLRVLSERRNMANEIRNHLAACRMTAQQARAVAIEDGHRGLTPDTYHQQALLAAQDAEERLQRFGTQTGQVSHQSQILEIVGAVSTEKCASFDEAIAQLEALADVFERQLASGFYW